MVSLGGSEPDLITNLSALSITDLCVYEYRCVYVHVCVCLHMYA